MGSLVDIKMGLLAKLATAVWNVAHVLLPALLRLWLRRVLLLGGLWDAAEFQGHGSLSFRS